MRWCVWHGDCYGDCYGGCFIDKSQGRNKIKPARWRWIIIIERWPGKQDTARRPRYERLSTASQVAVYVTLQCLLLFMSAAHNEE